MRRLFHLFVAVFLFLALPAASFATTWKTVKAGETVDVYGQVFLGGLPAGFKQPKPYIQQPKHGKITARTSVEQRDGRKVKVFHFFYTSDKGFKGRDEAYVGMSLQMRIRGEVKWVNTTERIAIIVK